MSKKEMEMKLIEISILQISVFLKYATDKTALKDELLRLVLRRNKLTEMQWFDEMGL